jgi:predicted nucleotide-binding protein (sugar kinase/HSP70/actin superfamily)
MLRQAQHERQHALGKLFFERCQYNNNFTVGLPAALHIYDELPLWKRFFDRLSIRTISSENYMDGIKAGKNLTGAEFCAPIAALHGHVAYLSQKADYIFLPYYMEEKPQKKNIKRNYCYYTQYVPAVITSAIKITDKEKILTPTLRTNKSLFYLKAQLYQMLKTIPGYNISFTKVSKAYDMALEDYQAAQEHLKEICIRESTAVDDICIVFLGRPYTLLSRSMNNAIPEMFARLGIKAFFQDMLSYEEHEIADIDPLLRAIHWKYAAKICEAATVIAKRRGLYAVFVTSFKCTPDSYAVEYVKKIFDSHNKPYLILQLDEHDSSVGYETRIEAGIRAFRNHFQSGSSPQRFASIVHTSALTRNKKVVNGKTLLIPNWDSITCKLLEAAVRKEGVDARIIDENRDSIRKSLRFNTGQCIPLNIIIQNSIDFIERNALDPENTVVWSPKSKIACNLGMFPYFTKDMLASYGKGLEKIPVFLGEITFLDISIRAAINCYLAYMFGGMLRKIGCAIRPYEKIQGMTDRAIEKSVEILYKMFLENMPKEDIIHRVISMFEEIEIMRENRPKVAIFGDLYVRDNDMMNQNLIRTIELNGGEVITTPYSQYLNIIADRYIKTWFAQGLYGYAALTKILRNLMTILDHKYHKYFKGFLPDQPDKHRVNPEELLSHFHLNIYHTGESLDNILKIFHLIHQYPDLALFVQTNPSYCCPSLVTEAMADKIEMLTGIPVVTIEYDGTGGSKNEDVIPYLKYPREFSKVERVVDGAICL